MNPSPEFLSFIGRKGVGRRFVDRFWRVVGYYYLTDHLGSVRTTLNETGGVVHYEDLYPFGSVMPGRRLETPEAPKESYTGYERDTEIDDNVYYAGARYYDAVIGRFSAMDRFMEKYPSLTPYQYAANNPMNLIDVNGDTVFVAYNVTGPSAYHGFIVSKNDETGKLSNIAEGMPTSKTLGVGGTLLQTIIAGPIGLGIDFTLGNPVTWGKLEANTASDPESKGPEERDVVPTPEGMTDEQFLDKIREGFASYKNQSRDDLGAYAALPVGNRSNSNSLAGSVLRAAGSYFVPERWVPGWNQNVLPSQRSPKPPKPKAKTYLDKTRGFGGRGM